MTADAIEPANAFAPGRNPMCIPCLRRIAFHLMVPGALMISMIGCSDGRMVDRLPVEDPMQSAKPQKTDPITGDPNRGMSNALLMDEAGNILDSSRREGGKVPGDVKVGMGTFISLANAGAVRQIERIDRSDQLYAGLVEFRGQFKWMIVDDSGHVVANRQVVRRLMHNEFPEAVVAAVAEHAGKYAIDRIEQQSENGRIVFDIRLAEGDGPIAVKAAPGAHFLQP